MAFWPKRAMRFADAGHAAWLILIEYHRPEPDRPNELRWSLWRVYAANGKKASVVPRSRYEGHDRQTGGRRRVGFVGTVFKVTTSGKERLILTFASYSSYSDGSNPEAPRYGGARNSEVSRRDEPLMQRHYLMQRSRNAT
jgi:hypothetical protein